MKGLGRGQAELRANPGEMVARAPEFGIEPHRGGELRLGLRQPPEPGRRSVRRPRPNSVWLATMGIRTVVA